MKKKLISMLLSLAMIVTAVPVTAFAAESEEANYGVNVALDATASASYTNIYSIVPGSMNDGALATDNASTSWNSWGGGDEANPVETVLTWDSAYEINGMSVIWWADNATVTANGNVTFPKSAQLQYLNADGEWVTMKGMTNEEGMPTDEVGVKVDTSSNNGINGNNKYQNYVKFPATIETTAIKMIIERNGTETNGVGISEWEVYGVAPVAKGENIALKATASADHENTPVANVNNGEFATNDPQTSWNTWGNKKEYPTPVTLTWDSEYEIESLQVMWWGDGGGVTAPKSAELQYWNKRSGEWVTITDLVDEKGNPVESVGVKFGTSDAAGDAADYYNGANEYWNGVILKTPVKTSAIRLLTDRTGTGTNGIGISELQVFGTAVNTSMASGTNIARAAKASANSANTPVANVNNGSLANDAGTSWNTWNSSETYPLSVVLTWDKPYEITDMRVMWWADNGNLTASGNVTFPKHCDVEYYDHGTDEWVKITNMTDEAGESVSSVGVKFGSATAAADSAGNYLNGSNRYWNGVAFNEPVKTTKLRLTVNRNGSGANGIGIGEWEVYGEEMTAEWNEVISANIVGTETVQKGDVATYTGQSLPVGVSDLKYAWSIADGSEDYIAIKGDTKSEKVEVEALENGKGTLNLTISHEEDGETVVRSTSFEIKIDGITSIDTYKTNTAAGLAPILPKKVVANGLTFDDSTPSLMSANNNIDFGEDFNSKLVDVTWEEVDPALYAADQVGNTFTVKGIVESQGEKFDAVAEITVKEKMVAPVANSTVTFENVQLTDDFWLPKQRVNAVNSLNKGIYEIEQASGGEPNFENAIKKLNGEDYNAFQGYVFQDSDIYKSIEAISYTLSVINDETDPELVAQREKLEEKLAYWISLIEQVQYADGYIDTHFTLRSTSYPGGSAPGTHRWRAFANHEMYNLGHFYEAAVAYTRYREGIGDPDYSLYVVAKRSADQIVALFGPGGTRNEVPGHEEIELAMVKLAKLVEEYEGAGTGQKYLDTVQLLINRRGQSGRDSGYQGGQYSQDNGSIKTVTEAVGHAVRACYFYAGVTDMATLLPEGDEDREAYLKTMDTIWDSVALTKTYITGGIGVASHGEDFGKPYELPNNNSYCETCAAIALANWNQRMNLVHEDAKYVDVVERTLYNAILVGTNLEGNLFFYSSRLEVSNGNGRSQWFACACCPPNLMRTIAKLSEYMYTVHADKLFVNMYIGSEGNVNIEGTNVGLVQETYYPWDGAVKLTVNPEKSKEFTMNIRIPGWVEDQYDKDVVIEVNGEAVEDEAEKGYVSITRRWREGDIVKIDIPMEIRRTEANPNVTTNTGRIALERGPIVYCMEKAGNAQINNDNSFNPLNFVIPRDAELQAVYNEDLLNGVVEINGIVNYNNGGTIEEAYIQAVPYYAWNNRGDNGVQGQNSSSKMLIWTRAEGEIPEELNDLEPEVPTVSFDDIVTPDPLPYKDVKETDWFYDAVEYTYYEGLMTGMDPETFGPYGTLSRAQFALILYRMEGEEAVETTKSFGDIVGDEWYGPAVLWAAEKGIVTGYQNGNFGPVDLITREQMAVMMYRYAKYLEQDVTKAAELGDFTDAASVSSFATDAMKWAVGNGIITGKEGGTQLDPQGNTARSEAAVIIQRFMEK